MGAAFTPEDLILLGYEDIQNIDVGPAAIALSGKAKAGIVEAEHTFAYIKTDATREDLTRVSSALRSRVPLYVLRSKSGPAESLLRASFGRSATIYQIEELLWARVSELFKAYIQGISESIPAEPNFIAPRGDQSSPKDRLDNYLVEYFTRDVSAANKKRLVVLKANAGVGKTTLCRQIVKEFARKVATYKIIPVYVEAAHWGGRVSSTSGLWDIIQLSLQNFDSGSNVSRNLFEAALKRGLVLFVFDGFDELCSNPRSSIAAPDVIESLQAWAEDSDARIVLTTRTPYWDSEIGDDPDSVYSLDLLPFNSQQAKSYIRKFFERDESGFHDAQNLYADVIGHAVAPKNSGGARAQFWHLPIAVSMICDAVKAGVSRSDWQADSLESLLVAICERETKRQNLNSTGARQFLVFQEIALLESNSELNTFERDDLLAAGLSESDVAKFSSHPLCRLSGDGRYTFTYDFFAPFLRALAIFGAVNSDESVIRRSVLDAMKAEENGKGFQIEHVVRLLERSDIEEIYSFLQKIPACEVAARSFVLHMLQRLADAQSDVVNSEDRTTVLMRGLADVDGGVVRGVRFTGLFERLDFSGVEFANCEFRDVSFRNVSFKGSTFSSCYFDGEVQFLTRADEDAFALAKLSGDCEMRGGARVSLESLVRNDVSQRSELLKDLLESGLAKFWHNGKFKGTLRKADWKKGILGRSRSADQLLEIFRRNQLVTDGAVSGVREGVWIFDRRAIGDLQNFMDHRRLSGSIIVVYNDLDRAFR